jgi:soluble lytic murein transglycosylase-like protein
VPAPIVAALIQAESNGDPNAKSKAGAEGLTQLEPGTAEEVGVHGNQIWDPVMNTIGGMRYLRQQLDRYHGNLAYALAAYNEGPGNVDKGVFTPETRAYVTKIFKALGVPPK